MGADAGFAAIIGLAILVLLYFAQARETASLRDQAADSAEHIQQLEHRLAQLTRAQVSSPVTGTSATTPAPPPPGIVRAGGGSGGRGGPSRRRRAGQRAHGPRPAPATVPAAPAGVGAPALSAATRLIPSADPEPDLDPRGQRRRRGQRRASRSGWRRRGDDPRRPASGDSGRRRPTEAPAASADARRSADGCRVSRLRVEAIARPSPDPRPFAPPATARAGPSCPPAASGSPSGGRSPISRGVIAVLALLGLIAVVVVVVVVTTSGGTNNANTSASTSAAQTAGAKTQRSGRRPAPRQRGGAVVGHRRGAQRHLDAEPGPHRRRPAHRRGLQGGHGRRPPPDQTQTATVVGYLPHHRAAALLVARSLKLGPASVQPVDQSNQTVACPASSTPCSGPGGRHGRLRPRLEHLGDPHADDGPARTFPRGLPSLGSKA